MTTRRHALALSFLLLACKNDPPRADVPAAAATAAATRAPADEDADETIAVLRALQPLVCEAHGAEWAWATCHDETQGYDHVLSCLDKSARDARAAADRFKAVGAKASCASSTESASAEVIKLTPVFLEAELAWLKSKKGALAGRLASKSLSDACYEEPACKDKPSQFDDRWKDMSLLKLNSLECTKTLFRCGTQSDNACVLAKILPRLGLMCKASDNRTGSAPQDALFVRATGRKLR